MADTPLIPRARIRAWVDDIDKNKAGHKNALNLLLTRQRALSRYVSKSAGQIGAGSKRNVLFIQGVLLRIFDLAGGRLGKITSEDIADAEARVGGLVPQLLPLDDGFAERMRAIEDRRQPHMLDECVSSLFDNPDLDSKQMAQLFFLAWIVVDAADRTWDPSPDFEGDPSYVYDPSLEPET